MEVECNKEMKNAPINYWYECPFCKSCHVLLDPVTYALNSDKVILKKYPEIKYCSEKCEILSKPLDLVL
jgi:hypothetical protein